MLGWLAFPSVPAFCSTNSAADHSALFVRLRPRSCTIDGKAFACGADGIACFELIRGWDADENVFMWAFDLIELDGHDLRADSLEVRKKT